MNLTQLERINLELKRRSYEQLKAGERVSSNLDRRSKNGRLRMIGDIYVFPSYLGICFCKEKGKKTYADVIKARYEVIKANNDVIKLRKQGKAPDGGHGRRWC